MEYKHITLQEIADKAHVSKSLVSRVLNNRPVRVSEQKRSQILKIANEFDYVPSSQILSASPLPNLDRTIALLLPHLNSRFMSVISETITQEAYENGYSVLIFDCQENSSLELKYLDLCHSLRVSGIILDSFSSSNNKKYLEKLSEWKIPFVFIDCYPTDSRFSIISSHNKEAMFQLTECLIARGHKNILSIIQDKATLTNVSIERLNGYYEAIGQHHLAGCNEIIYPDRDFRQQPIYSLMNSSIDFTAFIIHTGTDVPHFCNLIPVTKYASNTSFEIGVFDDFNLSFVKYTSGLYNSIYDKIVCVASQRPKEIASNAISVLINHIKRGEHFSPVQKFIDCDLIHITRKKEESV